jgi:hypothetical protein
MQGFSFFLQVVPLSSLFGLLLALVVLAFGLRACRRILN